MVRTDGRPGAEVLNPALLSSKFGSYLTPPDFMRRVHRFLHKKQALEYDLAGEVYVPKGPPPFLDPYSNDASLTGARHTCDITRGVNGNEVNWGDEKYRRPYAKAGFTFCNPEYGEPIAAALAKMHHEGHVLRSSEIIALLPARPDPAWCQDDVFASADAWVWVRGRFTFWLAIPIDDPRSAAERRAEEAETAGGKKAKIKPVPFLRRWYPKASNPNLPDPWRLLEPGIAVGPEVGSNGKPCGAPFPSLVPYWGDDVRGFARHFRSLGTLVIARDQKLPLVPSDAMLASCPAEVREYVLASSRRLAGVYPSPASERLRAGQE
jgi:hypothetical protein